MSPKDISSWLALLEAAKVQNHQAVLDVAKTVKENQYQTSHTTENVEVCLL